MAYQQNQHPYPQYGSGGGGGNASNNGGGGLQRQASEVSTPTTVYGRWESVARRLRQPPQAHTSPRPPPMTASPPPQYQPPQQQPQQQLWNQPPTSYAAEGIARAHHWVANNPHPPPPPSSAVVSPLSTTYTQGGGGGFSPSVISYQQGTLPPRPVVRQRMVCGIERTQFIIIMAITAMLLVSGIATGLGVGLALDNGNKAHSSSGASVPLSSSTPTTSIKPPSPSATSTGSTGVAVPGPIRCPQDDHNVYVSTTTPSKSFNIQCGRDYNSARGAQDLDHKATATMAECLDECAGRPGCVGAGWGLYQGSMTCWMKKGLGEPNLSDGWYFAQLQPSGSTG